MNGERKQVRLLRKLLQRIIFWPISDVPKYLKALNRKKMSDEIEKLIEVLEERAEHVLRGFTKGLDTIEEVACDHTPNKRISVRNCTEQLRTTTKLLQ